MHRIATEAIVKALRDVEVSTVLATRKSYKDRPGVPAGPQRPPLDFPLHPARRNSPGARRT